VTTVRVAVADPAPDVVGALAAEARVMAAAGAWADVAALLSARSHDAARHPELAAMLGEALLRTRQPRLARTWLRRALPRVTRSGDRVALRRAINLTGAANFEVGDLAAARAQFERAVELGRLDGDDLLLARATNNLGLIANMRGEHATALSLYRLAIHAYQRFGQAAGMAESYHNMAITFGDAGELRRADECESRAEEFAREAGNVRLVTMARVGRAEVSLRRGDPAFAAVTARRAAEEYARLPDGSLRADALRLLGVATLALGRPADALVPLQTAVALSRLHGDALIEAEARRGLAECHRARGSLAPARREAGRALRLFSRFGSAHDVAAPGWRCSATARSMVGRPRHVARLPRSARAATVGSRRYIQHAAPPNARGQAKDG
jgi:tetratricopeptide (TPR) repeat protein